jgi:hypothetical protein
MCEQVFSITNSPFFCQYIKKLQVAKHQSIILVTWEANIGIGRMAI